MKGFVVNDTRGAQAPPNCFNLSRPFLQPTPRFDHVAASFSASSDNQQADKLLLMGGRDAIQHFSDVHVLNLELVAWEAEHSIPAISHEVRATQHALHTSAASTSLWNYLQFWTFLPAGIQ